MFDKLTMGVCSFVFRSIMFFPLSAIAGSALAAPISLPISARQPGSHVKVVLEVAGNLRTQTNRTVREHPLKVLGRFLYEEQLLDQQGRSLRYYEQAEADLQVGDLPRKSELRDELRWIAVDPTNVDAIYQSPVGPLTRQELDLIAIPGLSSLVDRLLPDGNVEIGDSWGHEDELLARLLGIDAVTGNEVQSELVSVDESVARMRMAGKVIGAVQNVVTEIELSGKFNYDRQQNRITWLTLSIREQREIGVSTPGLDVTARLRMVIGVRDRMQFVSPRSVQRFTARPAETAVLEYRSINGDLTLLHDPRWTIFSEGPTATVLKFVEDDRMLAQCNLRILPSIGEEQTLSMEHFQSEIREALEEFEGQIVDSQRSTNATGYEVLRVVAAGIAGNAPVQWIYYHLTHPKGKRVSLVFTMGADDADRFAGEDLAVTGSLSIQVPPPSPTAALDAPARQ